MNLIRDKENSKIQLIDNYGIKLLELGFLADEFVFIFYTTTPIVLSESNDEFLYSYLQEIMDSKYDFSNKFSRKKDNEIIWFSDQYCDLENENEITKINRLIIRKEENKFILSVYNPFFEKNRIRRSYSLIALSPAGNGSYNRNIMTGTSFQDDFIVL